MNVKKSRINELLVPAKTDCAVQTVKASVIGEQWCAATGKETEVG
jgi:hypothetical protein